MRYRIALALAATLLLAARSVTAQRTTEQFIPVGQSPGISGVRSYIGPIVTVDAQRRSFTVRDSTGTRTITVAPATRIWLDRSAQRLTNEVGAPADLVAGRRVEVKYLDGAPGTADWIKIVVP